MTKPAPVRWWLPAMFASLLSVLAAPAGALPAALRLPAILAAPSNEHHTGKIVWVDLVTPDLATAERFYRGLFGWSFDAQTIGQTQYAVAKLDGKPVGGLVQRAPKGKAPQASWLTFISVADVAAAQKAAVAAGGKLIRAPHRYEARGEQAILADPQGAVFALLASSSGDPPDVLAAPGEWIWSSLLTRDPDSDAVFYQNVFGYEVFDTSSETDSQHLLFAADNFARASANGLANGMDKLHPHWLNFVRVQDTRAVVAQARMLGARVLVEPYADQHGGMIAVVADPGGAPFGLMEWTEADSAQVKP